MISRLGLVISRLFARFTPDPFVIAVLLTALTAILAFAFGPFPGAGPGPAPLDSKLLILLDAWRAGDGLWKLLAFSMQMCFVLVTGHALAASRPVGSLLRALAGLPRSTASGAAVTALAGCLFSFVNWGLGLIAGAIVAREVGRSLSRRGVRAHYPLIAAASFAGFMVWHGGLSGSAPLSMTSAASMAKVLPPSTISALDSAGLGAGVPLTFTTFSMINLAVTLGLLALIPASAALLAPRQAQDCAPIDELAPEVLRAAAAEEPAPAARRSPAEWLDTSRFISVLLAVPLLAAVARFGIAQDLRRFGLDEVNTTMFALGLLFHGSPRSYLAAVEDGARGCGGIITQFPLYAGIMALMVASGLDDLLASFLTEHATARTLPMYTYFTACIVNFFIPSGGGQWAVQGPVALEAGLALGVHPGKIVLAVAYGDQVTNMLQPFWALPLLAITGVRARTIVGYSSLLMVVGGLWIAMCLLIL
ncbi:MAG: short-chain fatty acid transporter [Phycisphaerales bacterium]|nr:short-chain fatty acid transporter [Phycisphaerales bacterium]